MTATGVIQKVYYSLSYRFGFAEWDINAPQPDLVRLEESGGIPGSALLDVGCGSGDNAIYLASKGYAVTGIDASASGIREARVKSRNAGIHVEFLVADVLHLDYYIRNQYQLAEPFDCVIDSGLFHGFRGNDIADYVNNISLVLKPGGRLIIHCFNEEAPREFLGPRQVSRKELAETFSDGWSIKDIQKAAMHSNRGVTSAWLASIDRE